MSEGFVIREDLLPISLVTTTRTLTCADADELFEYYRSLCERRIRFIAVSDIRGSREMPCARTRRHFAEHVARFRLQSVLWSVGSVIVVESSLLRGALTAIEWCSRPARPTQYCADLDNGLLLAIAALRAAKVPLGPRLERLEECLEEGQGPPASGIVPRAGSSAQRTSPLWSSTARNPLLLAPRQSERQRARTK
jgi:hypothetical protein